MKTQYSLVFVIVLMVSCVAWAVNPPTVTQQGRWNITTNSVHVKSHLVNDGGEACDVRYWAQPTAGGTKIYTAWRPGVYTGGWPEADITGLSPNTQYNWGVEARNSAGTDTDTGSSFTTLTATPSIWIVDEYDETTCSAVLKAWLDDDGGEACDVRFFYWRYPSGTRKYTSWQSGIHKSEFVHQGVTGLDAGTQYQWGAEARNSAGTDEVSGRSVWTLTPSVPSVYTYDAQNITETSATLKCGLDCDCGVVCQIRFTYWTEGGLEQHTPWKSNEGTTGYETIDGLIPNTVYSFKAEAKNSTGQNTGITRTFTTLALEPVTLTISSMAGGSVTDPGEGEFDYDPNTEVEMTATADANYVFTYWSGTAVDAGKVADSNDPNTTVIVDADYTLQAHFAPMGDIVFVDIPGGTFEMGDHYDVYFSDEEPVHTVTLDAFMMSKYETTNAQYAAYLNAAMAHGLITIYNDKVYSAGDTSYTQPYISFYYSQITYADGLFSVGSRDGYSMTDHPVVEVSWYGATAFCDYYGYRLPTEAEWEYAARGGYHDPYYQYPWGSNDIDCNMANYKNGPSLNSTDFCNPLNLTNEPYTSPVGYYGPQGAYGLCEMSGNVWEWCHDFYDANYYSYSPVHNPTGPSDGDDYVQRGGSWRSYSNHALISQRHCDRPGYLWFEQGFRVACDPNQDIEPDEPNEPEQLTSRPVSATQCPPIDTECPVSLTECPQEYTRCPEHFTQCPQSYTWCPHEATECPASLTECPASLTECPVTETQCPLDPTYCPPTTSTECPPEHTSCPEATECPYEPTECYPLYTTCPPISTECPTVLTNCPVNPTSCPLIITACVWCPFSSGQGSEKSGFGGAYLIDEYKYPLPYTDQQLLMLHQPYQERKCPIIDAECMTIP